MSSISGAQFETNAPTSLPPGATASAPASASAPLTGPPSSAEASASSAEQRKAAELRRETAWLRAAQEGDRAAYGQVIVACQDRLYNAVLRLVGDADDAAEITQEAFTRGLDKIDSYRGDASPYTWLFRIAMNLAISELRKTSRKRTFSLDGSSAPGRRDADDQASGLLDRVARDGAPQPHAALENRERDQQVLAALGRIDPEHRAVLVLRDIEGFDYQQMADVLGMPLGTLKSRLFRARVALRNELLPYLGGP